MYCKSIAYYYTLTKGPHWYLSEMKGIVRNKTFKKLVSTVLKPGLVMGWFKEGKSVSVNEYVSLPGYLLSAKQR
jgi:hypothetical protein